MPITFALISQKSLYQSYNFASLVRARFESVCLALAGKAKPKYYYLLHSYQTTIHHYYSAQDYYLASA